MSVTLPSPVARRGLALAVATALLVAACAAFEPSPTATTAPPATPAPTATAVRCPPASPPAPWTKGETATVTLDTTQGKIVIAVDGNLAPYATANFVALAACGFYNGVIFHRIIPGFVIQGGDGIYGRVPMVQWKLVGSGVPGYTIQDDPVTTPYGRGVVAMVRDPSQPNSAGSQFFIVLSDDNTDSLDAEKTYAILGKITSGMAAVDAIAALPNTGAPYYHPATDPPPTITTATVTRP